MRRAEDRLCQELQNRQHYYPPSEREEGLTDTDKNDCDGTASVAAGAEVLAHLERHKERSRKEAMAAVLRHREHLNAFRATEDAGGV